MKKDKEWARNIKKKKKYTNLRGIEHQHKELRHKIMF